MESTKDGNNSASLWSTQASSSGDICVRLSYRLSVTGTYTQLSYKSLLQVHIPNYRISHYYRQIYPNIV